MAHPLLWPGEYFFYPIGNTPAVCLSRDAAPEQSVNILLLGCGDPKNVLFTAYNEPPDFNRKLDFTCCDLDPAILARNVILYTMVLDNVPHQSLWNVFFHMYIDKDDEVTLLDHCRKLVRLSSTMQTWNTSPYGDLVKFCTESTLYELRKYWSLYVGMRSLPQDRKNAISDSFEKMKRFAGDKINFSSGRSCGPLAFTAEPFRVLPGQCQSYWRSGTTFSSIEQISRASAINPTFAYSKAGEGCYVHYGTNPATPFHHAPLFANAHTSVKEQDIIASAANQFEQWCTAFHSLASSPGRVVVRLVVGDLFATCTALDSVQRTGRTSTEIPKAPWTNAKFDFADDYSNNSTAPTRFDVIDTSNLQDHLGLLNILVASVPLRAPRGVIYTEALRTAGPEDPTKDLDSCLYSDVEVIGLLLGTYPQEYISGFNSLSNTHELYMGSLAPTLMETDPTAGPSSRPTDFRQLITWKIADSRDPNIGTSAIPSIDPVQLAKFLCNLYDRLFANEDHFGFVHKLQAMNAADTVRAALSMNDPHYTRESFVLLLKTIRRQLRIPSDQWLSTMSHWIDLQEAQDVSMPSRTILTQELYALLHYHGIHTVDILEHPTPKVGRFATWPDIPSLVRVWLNVPRKRLSVLGFPSAMNDHGSANTFPLVCLLKGRMKNTFHAIRAAFGTLSVTTGNHNVEFKEDPQGWSGATPLVVSFLVPTHVLSLYEPQAALSISLCLWPTPSAITSLIPTLGVELCVFNARFLDGEHVQVTPEYVLPLPTDIIEPSTLPESSKLVSAIGETDRPVAEFDANDKRLSTFVCRVNVSTGSARDLFRSPTTKPGIQQLSSCVMRLTLGSYHQDVAFPFPVSGAKHRLRLARKSGYIELIVPVSKPLSHQNIAFNPFPIVGQSLTLWNIHRVNLDRLPAVSAASKTKLESWLHSHIGLMMSQREKAIRKAGGKDVLVFVKDTIHSIIVRFTGIQGVPEARVFALQDKSSGETDAVLFLQSLLFDVQSHTVVCDGYLVPLTRCNSKRAGCKLGETVTVFLCEGELRAWKHLIPALVERCRKWHHGPNCEYKALGKIPLSEELETNPLCSCGQGKDVEEMTKNPLWRPFAKYAYRIALSPLFAVSLLEAVLPESSVKKDSELVVKCRHCGGDGQPKLMFCSRCKITRYCSKKCQQEDWRKHKTLCQAI